MKSLKKHAYEKELERKSEILYDLLFNKKVSKLGPLEIEQHKDHVVINAKQKEISKDEK